MRKPTLLLAAAMLVLPAAALAAKPPHPTQAKNTAQLRTTGKAAPKVLYILRGTLTAYAAANGATNGSVSITVASANRHGAALKKTTLTFPVSSATRIVLHEGAPVAAGDRAIVKVRSTKKLDATALQASVARMLVDQGRPKSS